MYALICDPTSGRTITSASSRSPAVRGELESSGNVEGARKVGELIAKRALEKDIREVAFNRNGFVYIGRVKAVAEAAREAGLTI